MNVLREVLALLSVFVVPAILVGFPVYGLFKRVPVYETFVEGAKEGFAVAVRIIPYLVAILLRSRCSGPAARWTSWSACSTPC